MKTMVLAALCLFSASVWATGIRYGGGEGTEQDPYRLWTAGHLNALANTPDDYDKSFILMADIDLAGYVYNRAVIAPDLEPDAWPPRGPHFSGTFDGNGFAIHNLTILNPDIRYIALFGAVKREAVIRNLHLKNVNIAGQGSVGGLVADHAGTIENCSVSGRVAGNYYVGGLVGFNNKGATLSDSQAVVLLMSNRVSTAIGGLAGGNNHAVIRRSNAICTVLLNHSARMVGGLAGENGLAAVIEDSYASCIIHTNGSHQVVFAGGLVGQNNGSILKSGTWNTHIRVEGNGVGGLVGNNQSTVVRCYAEGRISAGESSGGMAGVNAGYIVDSYCDAAVEGQTRIGGFSGTNLYGIARSYSLGRVSAADRRPGGFVGHNTGTVKFSFWDVETSGVAESAAGTPKTTEQMLSGLTFAGWGDDSWVITEGADRPRLKWEGTDGTPIQDEAATYSGGTGTPEDPFRITRIEQLAGIGDFPQDLSRSYVLTADLDFEGQVFEGVGAGQGFSGTFDGNGHLLSNLELSGNGEYIGLFPLIQQSGIVRNLHLSNVQAVGSRNLGAIAGKNEGLIEQCTVENLVVTCPETASARAVGGLAGHNTGTIRDSFCAVEMTVNASDSMYFGGMVGHSNGSIERCFAAGSVESPGHKNRFFGGFVGFGDYMSVTQDCLSEVNLISPGKKNHHFGAFSGVQAFRSRIQHCLSIGRFAADPSNQHFGGFVGLNGHSLHGGAELIGCFWDVEICGIEQGIGQNNTPDHEATGATTAMLQRPQTYVDAGWSFGSEQEPGIWQIESNAYPMLCRP